MYQHYREKQHENAGSMSDEDIQQVVLRMGQMALRGFWPPENRIVFSLDEAESSDDVKLACRIGLICQQETRTSVLTNRKETSLSFFHKTCGEKCTGKFLASLADENPKDFLSKLYEVRTVQDALSVQLILQFACSTNNKAAGMIICRLMQIFESELKPWILRYTMEMLEWDERLTIHYFLDMCLRCNFEAGNKGNLSHLLNDLFPEGKVFFIGISALTAVTLGYYLSHSQAGYIRSIRLMPSAHVADGVGHAAGPFNDIRSSVQKEIKNIPISVIRGICEEYIEKHPNMNIVYRNVASHSPAEMMYYIQLWQACEGLPSSHESNIRSIVDSLKHIHLEVFDITEFNVDESNIDHLLTMIQEGYLSQLLKLRVQQSGMNENQMDRLTLEIKKMPHLSEMDVSYNKSNRTLSALAESLPSMHALKILDVSHLWASHDDMAVFVKNFYQFGPRLLQLTINHNYINNDIASQLIKQLPTAMLLQELGISVAGLSRLHHNQLMWVMRHLSRLRILNIYGSQYPDDLMMSVADVMQSLPDLRRLHLSTYGNTPPQINSSTWKYFKKKLQKIDQLKSLILLRIALQRDDFNDLVKLCRRMQYTLLWYTVNCLPEGVEVPKDDFFWLW
ncbi:uncharacterized protein [Amphiura filiformis]|uniref:uncharacterized protein n=1 Tax=Amphiura filiformis TaxID=82378 RepID=UPI003B224A86